MMVATATTTFAKGRGRRPETSRWAYGDMPDVGNQRSIPDCGGRATVAAPRPRRSLTVESALDHVLARMSELKPEMDRLANLPGKLSGSQHARWRELSDEWDQLDERREELEERRHRQEAAADVWVDRSDDGPSRPRSEAKGRGAAQHRVALRRRLRRHSQHGSLGRRGRAESRRGRRRPVGPALLLGLLQGAGRPDDGSSRVHPAGTGGVEHWRSPRRGAGQRRVVHQAPAGSPCRPSSTPPGC